MFAHVEVLKSFGDAGLRQGRRGLSLETNTSPHHACYLPRRIEHSRSDGKSVITEIIQTNVTLRVPPVKVKQGHWNRHGSISY